MSRSRDHITRPPLPDLAFRTLGKIKSGPVWRDRLSLLSSKLGDDNLRKEDLKLRHTPNSIDKNLRFAVWMSECSYECWSLIGEPKCSIIHAPIPYPDSWIPIPRRTLMSPLNVIQNLQNSLKWIDSLQRWPFLAVSAALKGTEVYYEVGVLS
ncbi:hypothetical protein AVEN_72195-1 [Araneus ventricosus]|uniref:Uncharacterized protein n=1 Tax=Araneus ventricosus TaxID=182803 RepID=A0A4Y2ELB7_ARAVE|nr:hypothetical protein AVEN_72195-1 [Araneus ventricosus]